MKISIFFTLLFILPLTFADELVSYECQGAFNHRLSITINITEEWPVIHDVVWTSKNSVNNLFSSDQSQRTHFEESKKWNELAIQNGDIFRMRVSKTSYQDLKIGAEEFEMTAYTTNSRGFVWVDSVDFLCSQQ